VAEGSLRAFFIVLSTILFPLAAAAGDLLILKNNHNSDSAVVLIDGQDSGGTPMNDSLFRGSSSADLGDLSPSACSEIVVFSDGNGMLLWTPLYTSDSDTVEVMLPEMIVVPLAIWLLYDASDAIYKAELIDRAEFDFTRANDVYDAMNCGIKFTSQVTEIAAPWLLSADCTDYYSLRELGYTPGSINVYYVKNGFSQQCKDDPAAIVLTTEGSDNESLAHELGHAFGLSGHYDECDNDPNASWIMCEFKADRQRTKFSEGECFRCNLEPSSFLIQYGLRKDSPRLCASETFHGMCPSITLDAPD
jgi:hypothetical protein